MKKSYSLGLIAFFILVLALALTGCGSSGQSNSTPSTPTQPVTVIAHVTFICESTPDATATAFKTFLDAKGYITNIIGINDITTADFSAADMIIVGNIPVDWQVDYPAQAQAVYNVHKPILVLKDGSYLLTATPFASDNVFVNALHTGSQDCSSVNVDDATSWIWNTPNAINVTTGADLEVYSTTQALARGIYWNNPPFTATKLASNKFWVQTNIYGVVCYEIENGVRYGFWGFGGPPTEMTSDGQKLFINLVDKLTRSVS